MSMYRLVSIALVCLIGILTSSAALPDDKAPTDLIPKLIKVNENGDDLVKLLKARHNAAVRECQSLRAYYDAGKITLESMVDSRQRLFNSKLALTDSVAKRIAIYEERVELGKGS